MDLTFEEFLAYRARIDNIERALTHATGTPGVHGLRNRGFIYRSVRYLVGLFR